MEHFLGIAITGPRAAVVPASRASDKAAEAAKKVAPVAIKMACKLFGSQCPKACDSAVDAVAPTMKNYKIPTKCFSKTAKDACHQACTDICKGK